MAQKVKSKAKSPTKTATRKPKVVQGSSTLKSTRPSWLRWEILLPLILVIAAVGGFMVYRSNAATASKTWGPGHSSTKVSGSINVGKKSNGLNYWAIPQPKMPLPDCLEKSTCGAPVPEALLPLGTITLNERSTSPNGGEYCIIVSTGQKAITVGFSGAAVYTNGENLPGSSQAPIPPVIVAANTKRRDVCINADIAKGALQFNFSQTNKDAWYKPATKAAGLAIFKKKKPVYTVDINDVTSEMKKYSSLEACEKENPDGCALITCTGSVDPIASCGIRTYVPRPL